MELVKIETKVIGNDEIRTVNARELHQFLEVGRDFNTWIRGKIERFGFAEGVDFITELETPNRVFQDGTRTHGGARRTINYYITIDMGKELAMVENNDKGREVRRYFIEVEKQYRAMAVHEDPVEVQLAKALLLSDKIIKDQKLLIESMSEKVDEYDSYISCDGLLTIEEYAKLTFKQFGLGRNGMFNLLRDKGFILENRNPRQTYVNSGYFTLKVGTYRKPGSDTLLGYSQTLITPKGVTALTKAIQLLK